MSKRETNFKDSLRARLHAAGAVTFKAHGGPFAVAGWPDLWIGSRAWSGWVELKAGRNKATPLQLRRIAELREAGVPALVLHADDVAGMDGAAVLALLASKT